MNQAIIFSAVQTIITAMLIWWLQRSLTKRDKKREKQDAARIKNELLLIQGVGVAIDLGEATATATTAAAST